MIDLLIITFEDSDTASRRFRVEAFEPFYKDLGLSYKMIGYPNSLLRRIGILKNLPRSRVTLLQKKLLRAFEFNWLKRKTGKLIFDFDDAIFLDSKGASRFQYIVSHSDTVFAGNRLLANRAEEYNRKTMVVPTGLDLTIYKPVQRKMEGPMTIGWIGTRGNLPNLKIITPVLKELRNHHPFSLTYVCDREDPGLREIGWHHIPWTAENEIGDLSRFDIGIMPLNDTPHNRGKCAFKLLQYMAMGIPAVASQIGVNNEVISNGVNGFLAKNKEEWIKYLKTLLTDSERYQLIRTSALDRIRDFDLPVIFEKLIPYFLDRKTP